MIKTYTEDAATLRGRCPLLFYIPGIHPKYFKFEEYFYEDSVKWFMKDEDMA